MKKYLFLVLMSAVFLLKAMDNQNEITLQVIEFYSNRTIINEITVERDSEKTLREIFSENNIDINTISSIEIVGDYPANNQGEILLDKRELYSLNDRVINTILNHDLLNNYRIHVQYQDFANQKTSS